MLDYSLSTDETLTGLLQNGDHEAFNEIYRRYWKIMLSIAWNHSRDESVSKDIVHEVFISLWERKIDISIQSLPAFLAKSVRFAVFKQHQRAFRRTELAALNYHQESVYNQEEKLDALFLQEYLNGVIDTLPERCRLVFHCSRNLGMKNAEIAAFANISEKAVEANLTRALKIIRREIKNNGWMLIVLQHYYKSIC